MNGACEIWIAFKMFLEIKTAFVQQSNIVALLAKKTRVFNKYVIQYIKYMRMSVNLFNIFGLPTSSRNKGMKL